MIRYLTIVILMLATPLLDTGKASAVDQNSSQLVVTAKILSQSYCHVDDSSFGVLINVQLHFENVSDVPVILSKKIDAPSLVRVAKDGNAIKSNTFEFAPTPDRFVANNPQTPDFGQSPSLHLFAILLPGQARDTDTQTTVIASQGNAKDAPPLRPGVHVLQLGISLWPYYGYDSLDELQRKWSRFGILQHGLVYTNVIPFVIPKHFKNPSCRVPRPLNHR